MKLTKTTIASLPRPAPGEQRLYWDDDLKGFGVLCSGATGTRSFVVQRGVNGRKRRVTLGRVNEFERAKKSLEEVRALAAQHLLDMRSGKDPKAKDYASTTLKQALDDYLAARPNLADRSREGYRATVETWFKAWLSKPLLEITADLIEARYHAIKKEAARRKGSDLFVMEAGAATANAALRALRAVWHFAHGRAPDLPPWPTQRLKGQWYRAGRRRRHVRADDLKDFYDAVNERDAEGHYTLGRDVRDLILLMLFTGLRRGEACSLKWQHVDLSARVIRLPSKATKNKVPLDLPTSDLVHDLLTARRALGQEGPYVFPGRGKTGHLEEPKKAFDRIAKRCGLRMNPHALRSTFITVAASVSISEYVRKGLVNHAIDQSDVTGGYVQEVELRKGAQAVARQLKLRCGIATQRTAKKPAKKARKKKAA